MLPGADDRPEPIESFELSGWEEAAPFTLAEHHGKIVILDFFAYWCAPCNRLTPMLEKAVAEHYAQGNPHGVPVRLYAVNVESGHPVKTNQFIMRTGATHVLDGSKGKILQQFGHHGGLPLVVIIDGTHATKEKPDYRLVYAQSGFNGLEPVRKTLDKIQPVSHSRLKRRQP